MVHFYLDENLCIIVQMNNRGEKLFLSSKMKIALFKNQNKIWIRKVLISCTQSIKIIFLFKV